MLSEKWAILCSIFFFYFSQYGVLSFSYTQLSALHSHSFIVLSSSLIFLSLTYDQTYHLSHISGSSLDNKSSSCPILFQCGEGSEARSGLWQSLPQLRADSIPTGCQLCRWHSTDVRQQQCKEGPSKPCSVLIKIWGSGVTRIFWWDFPSTPHKLGEVMKRETKEQYSYISSCAFPLLGAGSWSHRKKSCSKRSLISI